MKAYLIFKVDTFFQSSWLVLASKNKDNGTNMIFGK